MTLWGSIRQIKGFEWPKVAGGKPAMDLSASIEGPCDLTLHLRSGKTLKIRTRSLLIISRGQLRDDDRDTIDGIAAPIAGDYASAAQKVTEAEKLMAEWGAIPNARMKQSLTELSNSNGRIVGHFLITASGPASTKPTTQPVPNWLKGLDKLNPVFEFSKTSAAWADLDESSQCAFTFWRNQSGKYNTIANICVKQSVWKPIFDHAHGVSPPMKPVSRPWVPIP